MLCPNNTWLNWGVLVSNEASDGEQYICHISAPAPIKVCIKIPGRVWDMLHRRSNTVYGPRSQSTRTWTQLQAFNANAHAPCHSLHAWQIALRACLDNLFMFALSNAFQLFHGHIALIHQKPATHINCFFVALYVQLSGAMSLQNF